MTYHHFLARLVLVALTLALAFPALAVPVAWAAPASASLPAPAALPQPAGSAAPSLANFLLPDGRLSPAASGAGSLDARGYRLASAPGEAPRFAPVNAPLAPAGDENWDTGFISSGTTGGDVYVIAFSPDGTMYVGGKFTAMGALTVNRLTRWNGIHWEALGTGLNTGYVYALAFGADGKLYVGGSFSSADGVSASNIAVYDPATSVWSALGSGTDAAVRALVFGPDGHLKVGGDFTKAGGVSANHVADLDPATGTWSALAGGLGVSPADSVYALAYFKGDLYAGGSFYGDGNYKCASCVGVARWDPAASGGLGDWVALNNGVNGQVDALAGNDDFLYIGGQFSSSGEQPLSYIASWDGSAWAAVGGGFDNGVHTLAFDSDGALLAGGVFLNAGDTSCPDCKYIARLNGGSWEPLGTGVNKRVRAVAVRSGTIHIGGLFSQAGSVPAVGIARYAGGQWHGYGTAPDNAIHALARAADGTVLAGGAFGVAGEISAGRIARWNPTTRAWSALGSGAASGLVKAIAVYGSDIYIGGTFPDLTGCADCHYIARWDGTTWNALGSGLSGDVYALAVAANGAVYAGGKFSGTFSCIARWDGTQWLDLDGGVPFSSSTQPVTALAFDGAGKLWVGGTFSSVNGSSIASSNIAVWNQSADSGDGEWSAVTPGVNGIVQAILPVGSDVYVGGTFRDLADSSCADCKGVAVLHGGTTWAPLGAGLGATSSDVRALARDSRGTLYAGGSFTNNGNSTCSNCQRVAKFEGGSWQGVGSGMNNQVYALQSAGDLYAGGTFTQAGGHVSPYFARSSTVSYSVFLPFLSAGQP